MSRRAPVYLILVGIVAAVFGLAVSIGRYDVYRIPGIAMVPALEDGDRIFVRTDVGVVHRGDIVAFRGGAWDWGTTASVFVKRVVGVGGDAVLCCDERGLVRVNERSVREPYVPNTGTGLPSWEFSVQVPAESLFVLGDNREHSQDSRHAIGQPGSGAIPLTDVVGVVVGFSPGGESLSASAFVDAGLPGGTRSMLADFAPVLVSVAGVALTLSGLIWLLATRIRARSREISNT